MANTLSLLPRAPSDLSKQLRRIADAIDRGDITSFVGAYCEHAEVAAGEYGFLYGTSKATSLVLANLLHYECLERMKR